jgi:hypothetical protein
MTTELRRRWYQFSLRTMFVVVTLASLMLAYVGSYYQISRRGMREAVALNLPGFFYVPSEGAMSEDYVEPWREHYRLMDFYAPLNWLDQKLFGSLSPIRGGIRRITDKRGDYRLATQL